MATSTQTLFSQHRDLITRLSLVEQSVSGGVSQAPAIAVALSNLSAALSFHLSCEDTLLYPRIYNSSDPALAELARTMIKDMGNLADVFRSFYERWGNAQEIAAHFGEFSKSYAGVAQRLIERMRREDLELYPRVEMVRN